MDPAGPASRRTPLYAGELHRRRLGRVDRRQRRRRAQDHHRRSHLEQAVDGRRADAVRQLRRRRGASSAWWAAGGSGARPRATAARSRWSDASLGTDAAAATASPAPSGSSAWAVGGRRRHPHVQPGLRRPGHDGGRPGERRSLRLDGSAASAVTLTAVDAGRAGVARNATTPSTAAGSSPTPRRFAVPGPGTPLDHLLVGRPGGERRSGRHRLREHRRHAAHGRLRCRLRLARRRRAPCTSPPADAGGSGVAADRVPAGRRDRAGLTATGDAFLVAAGVVGDGAHTYEIRAVDAAGNVSGTEHLHREGRRDGADHHADGAGRRRPLRLGHDRAHGLTGRG